MKTSPTTISHLLAMAVLFGLFVPRTALAWGVGDYVCLERVDLSGESCRCGHVTIAGASDSQVEVNGQREWAPTRLLLTRSACDANQQRSRQLPERVQEESRRRREQDLEESRRGSLQAQALALHLQAPSTGLDWVRIEGGAFRMGSTSGDSAERPVRRVTVKTFELGKTEVTVGQYATCVKAGACVAPDGGGGCNWGLAGREDHPVNCVDWGQASAFAKWAQARLPSEAEWEFAARSRGHNQTYPWGDSKATCQYAVMDRNCIYDSAAGEMTAPVCSKPDGNSAQGVCDLAGNVSEWVADWYGPYGKAPINGTARSRAAEHRVRRGGGWLSSAYYLQTAVRRGVSPGLRHPEIGFRLAR